MIVSSRGRRVLLSSIARTLPPTRPTSYICSRYRRAKSSSSSSSSSDPAFEVSGGTLRYGPTSTSEVGHDLRSMNARRVMIFVDPNVRTLDPYRKVVESIDRHARSDLVLDVYDDIRVEPNDVSLRSAISYVEERVGNYGPYDAFIALGGGSTIDTAKAANLYSCHPPDDFYDYVNPPLGGGMSPPGPLVPLIAIPTTSGTGSEATSVAVFDDGPSRSKTGIAHRSIRPTLGIIDPDNVMSVPSAVALYSGLDVLCHALESYTAIPGGRPASPSLRPSYQGSNPMSDVWSLHALRECATYLPNMVDDPGSIDGVARTRMCHASSAAGMGFGNAGVHLCHGMSYAVASQVRGGYVTEGYPRRAAAPDVEDDDDDDDGRHGLVAHGLSVAICAPSVFRFTGEPGTIGDPIAEMYSRDRHAECAAILADARIRRTSAFIVPSEMAMRDSPGEALACELLELMNELRVPVGIRSLGYDESDVESLARGTLPQHRVTKLSPRQPVEMRELRALFADALDG